MPHVSGFVTSSGFVDVLFIFAVGFKLCCETRTTQEIIK